MRRALTLACLLAVLTWGQQVRAERYSFRFDELREVSTSRSPIRLEINGSDRAYQKAWTSEGRARESSTTAHRHVVYFSIGTAYGYVRFYDHPSDYRPNVPSPRDGLRYWEYPREHDASSGRSGEIDHGPIAFNYIRFTVRDRGNRPDCFAYVGSTGSWLVDGWTCGAAGQFDGSSEIASFIKSIGYPKLLSAKSLSLPTSSSSSSSSSSSRPGGSRFEAERTPYVTSEVRRQLEKYESASSPKALALTDKGAWAWVSGKTDTEDARRQALEKCRAYTSDTCFIYAVNDRVAD